MFKQFKDTNYEVSENGEIKRTYKNGNTCYLKYSINKNGYKAVNLRIKGKSITKNIHRLVAETHIENNNEKYTIIDHIDRDKLNNNKSNLRWIDYIGNGRNSSTSLNRKGCICKTKDKVKDKVYEYYRVFWYDTNHKKKSKRFKTLNEAELFKNNI
tara:strand:+ start:95 stop:562 length:468 start_codon:yes stop_codon:yes gene_type:complete